MCFVFLAITFMAVFKEKKRINLETRTICVNDEKNFVIPRNIDSYTNKKKINWFCPLTK